MGMPDTLAPKVTLRIAGAPLSFTRVEACMPPKVPVPKPGPCPGTKRGAKKAADAVKKAATPAKRAVAKKATKAVKAAPRPARPTADVPARDLINTNGQPLDRAQLDAIAGILGSTAAGHTIELDDVKALRNRTTITAALRAPDGRLAGEISIELAPGSSGVTATHRFSPSTDTPSQAAYAALENRMMDWYETAGVNRLEYDVSDDDYETYARANSGLDWGRTGRIPTEITDGLLSDVRRREPGWERALEMLERAEDNRPGDPGYPAPFDIYNMGRPANAHARDQWPGQEYFNGVEWKGRRYLPRDPASPRTSARARKMKEAAALHDRFITQNAPRTQLRREPNDPASLGAFYIDMDTTGQQQQNLYETMSGIMNQTGLPQDPLFTAEQRMRATLSYLASRTPMMTARTLAA